jgi:tetratricopeptide (TPR) repeat protein
MIRHLAYFEELAALDEREDSWREISAGLVVLRLVDSWFEQGASVVTPGAWNLGAVINAVAEIPNGRAARGMLKSVVDAMVDARTPDAHIVAPRLMAYARSLDFDARWNLAIDVYRAVISHSEPLDDADTVIAAHLRLGFCLRQVGEISESAAAYEIASQIAERVGDMMGVLRARIGDAKIALLRGNLPRAESILDATIDDAERHGYNGVHSMALHDRANAAYMRGDFELAVKLSYRALDGTETDRNRDRILHDLAMSFYRLGVRSAARDAFLVLMATTQEQYTRWASCIQLIAIAADDGVRPAFERYRRELADQSLPPFLSADYELQTGRGLRLMGEFSAAKSWLEAAVQTAKQHQIHQFLHESQMELELARAGAGAWKGPEPEPDVSVDVAEVVDAVRNMREAVEVVD